MNRKFQVTDWARIVLRLFTIVACFCLIQPILASQETVTRQPGESLEDFAKKITEQPQLGHPPVEVAFGPWQHAVVLISSEMGGDQYSGLILAPKYQTQEGSQTKGPEEYVKYDLPVPDHNLGPEFVVTVEAVFGASIGSNAQRELVILYSAMKLGGAHLTSFDSDVYHWTGKSLEYLPEISERVSSLKNAAAVRRKLRTLQSPK